MSDPAETMADRWMEGESIAAIAADYVRPVGETEDLVREGMLAILAWEVEHARTRAREEEDTKP